MESLGGGYLGMIGRSEEDSFSQKPPTRPGRRLSGGRNFCFSVLCGAIGFDRSSRRKSKSKSHWCFKARTEA
jgi:hypothetical protein